jgi:hypothetical protein
VVRVTVAARTDTDLDRSLGIGRARSLACAVDLEMWATGALKDR